MDPVLNKALLKLSERAKELDCLYKVEEAISGSNDSESSLFNKLLEIIPSGMQFSTICEMQVKFGDKVYQTDDFRDSEWFIKSDIVIDSEVVGYIKVVYTQFIRSEGGSQFLPEEQKMLDNIASRVSWWLFVLIIKGSGLP